MTRSDASGHDPVPSPEEIDAVVRAVLAPALEQWGFSFSGVQQAVDPELGPEQAVLFEADPQDFDTRYPEADLPGSYGPDWPGYCVDLWIHFMLDDPRVFVEVEGFPDRVFSGSDEDAGARRVLAWREDPAEACRAMAEWLSATFAAAATW